MFKANADCESISSSASELTQAVNPTLALEEKLTDSVSRIENEKVTTSTENDGNYTFKNRVSKSLCLHTKNRSNNLALPSTRPTLGPRRSKSEKVKSSSKFLVKEQEPSQIESRAAANLNEQDEFGDKNELISKSKEEGETGGPIRRSLEDKQELANESRRKSNRSKTSSNENRSSQRKKAGPVESMGKKDKIQASLFEPDEEEMIVSCL